MTHSIAVHRQENMIWLSFHGTESNVFPYGRYFDLIRESLGCYTFEYDNCLPNVSRRAIQESLNTLIRRVYRDVMENEPLTDDEV